MAAHDWEKFQKFFENRNVEKCAFHLIPYLKPNSKIIDVGCGVGTITLDFARRVPQGSVIGIDHSEQSVATARAQAEKQGLTNVQFFVGDAENIDYPDDTFDIAHAHQVMLHLPRPVQSLRHMYRIVKPGGVVGIRDLTYYNQASKAKGARGGDSGTVNHIWMHEAGFGRENIHSGSVGFDNDKEEMPTLVHGAIGFATSRNESDDYIQKLREDGDAWVADPSSRAIALDSWVVGVK